MWGLASQFIHWPSSSPPPTQNLAVPLVWVKVILHERRVGGNSSDRGWGQGERQVLTPRKAWSPSGPKLSTAHPSMHAPCKQTQKTGVEFTLQGLCGETHCHQPAAVAAFVVFFLVLTLTLARYPGIWTFPYSSRLTETVCFSYELKHIPESLILRHRKQKGCGEACLVSNKCGVSFCRSPQK